MTVLIFLPNRYNHNYLRITRILLAIKELGHKDLMLPWLKFMADLVYKKKLLNHAKESFEEYWQQTLDEKDFCELQDFVQECKSTESTKEKAKSTLHNTSIDTHESNLDASLPNTNAYDTHDNERPNFPGSASRTNPLTTHYSEEDTILGTPTSTSPLTTPSNTHENAKVAILRNPSKTSPFTTKSKTLDSEEDAGLGAASRTSPLTTARNTYDTA